MGESVAGRKMKMLADVGTQVEHEVEVKFSGVPNSQSVVVRPGVMYFLDLEMRDR